MAIDDSRRPEPGPPQPGPVPSDDGLTGSQYGQPPPPGEAGDKGIERERERAEDVEGEGSP
jgi:hypothetical protein